MSDSIKKLFRSMKKGKGKFTGIGPGHKLTDDASSSASGSTSSSSKKPSADAYVPPKRSELSSASQRARDAALNRMGGSSSRKDPVEFNTSLAAIRAQAKRELQAEQEERGRQQQQNEKSSEEAVSTTKTDSSSSSSGVYFRCPLVSDEVLSKLEWQGRIKEFLYEQLNYEEKGLTSCLIIVNCNVRERAEACKEIITKYVENIVNHPTEEKYRKIRKGNRIFVEKVRDVEGALDLLRAAGFVEQTVDEEELLIWMPKEVTEGEKEKTLEEEIGDLKELLSALADAEVIPLEVDRNLQVLLPSQARRLDLPEDFYRVSAEEMKREQRMRADALEQSQILKTKAMREREEARALTMYRYAFIRVRFPDGIYVQGTFSVRETLGAVYEFVQACLKHEEVRFGLTGPAGVKLPRVEDQERTLLELKLVPNVNLAFQYEQEVSEEMQGNYVREELMMLIKEGA